MKNFKISIAWVAVCALLFTSCSKEEANDITDDQELIQLSFGSALNDFNNQNKQATPIECREGTPSYVMIGITDESGEYIGDDDGDDNPDVNLIEVGLKWNNSMEIWETVYSEDLALPAGDYTLQHFIVYDTDDEVLWVAPREGGSFADYVDNALPQDFTLAAGTKPYINVDVLCYYARSEEAYGYVFFDITPVPVENSYCVFVNYCDGRDYPAHFNIDIYTDEAMTQEWELSESMNSVSMVGGWPSATVLCFALPDLGDATLYARVTVLDHEDLDYTADADAYYEFEITQASIDALENQVPAYHHVRINCDGDDPGNGNGGEDCNSVAQCNLDVSGDLPGDFCNTTFLNDSADGWVEVGSAAELYLVYEELGGELATVATVDVMLDGDVLNVTLDTPENDVEIINETDHITAYAVEVRPSVDGEMSTDCWETDCANLGNDPAYGAIELSFDGFTFEYPVFVKVSTVSCFEPVE